MTLKAVLSFECPLHTTKIAFISIIYHFLAIQFNLNVCYFFFVFFSEIVGENEHKRKFQAKNGFCSECFLSRIFSFDCDCIVRLIGMKLNWAKY